MSFIDQLQRKASESAKKIILPESDDNRVLVAADEILAQGKVKLLLLGEEAAILQKAKELGLRNIAKAELISPADAELLDKTAEEFAKIRASKGLTFEEAREIVANDISYFATMLVQLGIADGMVSGAVHTTAETIRPALQIIKTKPGRKTVSGAFFMCIPNNLDASSEQVILYADCAVNLNPDAETLADIAMASDETAKQFGLESKIALLSYSSGDSGKGADVDLIKEVAQILNEKIAAEGLSLEFEGPIQYDAASNIDVAKTKLPDSKVAGQASVFVFPDLKCGNITYKAVQRTSGAIAIGPVLQGLKKPVNDLSRGALVEDIVNTIYLTAVQAQNS